MISSARYRSYLFFWIEDKRFCLALLTRYVRETFYRLQNYPINGEVTQKNYAIMVETVGNSELSTQYLLGNFELLYASRHNPLFFRSMNLNHD